MGLVLSHRPHKERDLLVKIFTESFGKRTFFIRNAKKSQLTSSLQPFSILEILATINEDGFSFITDVGEVQRLSNLTEDIFANAYASYIISLSDVAIADNEYDSALYGFLVKTLEAMNEGLDKEILTNLFELQILSRFGVNVNLLECAICGKRDLPMDFSFKYSGCLCSQHFDKDRRRLHANANIIYLAGQLTNLSLENLATITVKTANKKRLREFIDALYEEYVGVKLRAKRFLDGMDDWAQIMK